MLASTISGCVSISALASLVGIPIGISSSAATLNVCVISTGIKRYKSITKKNKNKHNKRLLLAKTKLTTIEVLISKALSNSNISCDEFVSIDNVLIDYDEMKKEIKNSNN